MISNLYLENGNFSKAEKYLLAALGIALQTTNHVSEKVNPICFRLKLKLCDLYLDSYNFEKGIEGLEDLNQNYRLLPQSSRSIVLIKLAKVYI